MKTLKALKITSILQMIFCLLCIASTICFALAHYSAEWRTPFRIANILVYGWLINPVAPISFVICLLLFLVERRQEENRQLIGRKWIWIIAWPIITTLFYFSTLILTIAFTGGV